MYIRLIVLEQSHDSETWIMFFYVFFEMPLQNSVKGILAHCCAVSICCYLWASLIACECNVADAGKWTVYDVVTSQSHTGRLPVNYRIGSLKQIFQQC